MVVALLRLLALGCLVVLPHAASAAELAIPKPLPKFSDHPAKVYRGRLAQPILDDEWLRARPELISAAMDERIMVAGHYVLAIMTCGASCQQPLLIEAATGKVLSLPSVSGWRKYRDDFKAILSRPDRWLIVLQGALNEKNPVGMHYYVVGDGKLKHLHTVDTDGDFRKKPNL